MASIKRAAAAIATILVREGVDFAQSKAVFEAAWERAGPQAVPEHRGGVDRLTVEEEFRLLSCDARRFQQGLTLARTASTSQPFRGPGVSDQTSDGALTQINAARVNKSDEETDHGREERTNAKAYNTYRPAYRSRDGTADADFGLGDTV